MAGREERWAIVDEGEHTLTVINPWQFEVGQCCVITRRHVATLLDLSHQECEAIMVSAKRVAQALVKTYQPLGLLTFKTTGSLVGKKHLTSTFMSCPGRRGAIGA
jgi:diadenosine tetraphosphate (Ap4A) HIT family hydrolase